MSFILGQKVWVARLAREFNELKSTPELFRAKIIVLPRLATYTIEFRDLGGKERRATIPRSQVHQSRELAVHELAQLVSYRVSELQLEAESLQIAFKLLKDKEE